MSYPLCIYGKRSLVCHQYTISDNFLTANTRTWDNHEINPQLRSPSFSGDVCLTFLVKYKWIGGYDGPNARPRLSILIDGKVIGNFQLPPGQDRWLKAQYEFSVNAASQFNFYLEGQNFSVSLDDVSLASGQCPTASGRESYFYRWSILFYYKKPIKGGALWCWDFFIRFSAEKHLWFISGGFIFQIMG